MARSDERERMLKQFVEHASTVVADRAGSRDSVFYPGLCDRIKALRDEAERRRKAVADMRHERAALSAAETAAIGLRAAIGEAQRRFADAGFEEKPTLAEARGTMLAALDGACAEVEGEMRKLDEGALAVELAVNDMETAAVYLSKVVRVQNILDAAAKTEQGRLLPVLRDLNRTLRDMRTGPDRMGKATANYVAVYGVASGLSTVADDATAERVADAIQADINVLAECHNTLRQIL